MLRFPPPPSFFFFFFYKRKTLGLVSTTDAFSIGPKSPPSRESLILGANIR
jgi:hypothetical protein